MIVDLTTYTQTTSGDQGRSGIANFTDVALLVREREKDARARAEIIGIQTPELRQSLKPSTDSELTETTFDTSTYPDGAIVLLTNSTGATRTLVDVGIVGSPVIRMTGRAGYVHDAFQDWGRIETEGEILLERGNAYIIDSDQVTNIAHWLWRFNSGIYHVYVLTVFGDFSWIIPGETYTLAIGGAGQQEYIDSTVRCISVQTELPPAAMPQSVLIFWEVMENWTKGLSNDVARFIASGHRFRLGVLAGVIIVVAAGCSDRGDIYADGAADQTEINQAIDYVSEVQGGGTVQLSRGGQYATSGAIVMKSGVKLDLNGATITKNHNASCITAIGTSGAHLSDISIVGPGTLTRDPADTSTTRMIEAEYVDRLTIDDMILDQQSNTTGAAVKFIYCTETRGQNLTIWDSYTGFYAEESDVAIVDNKISHTEYQAGSCFGIWCQNVHRAIMTRNYLVDLLSTSGVSEGIHYDEATGYELGGSIIADNMLYNLSTISGNSYGIEVVDGDQLLMTNNALVHIHGYGSDSIPARAIVVAVASVNTLVTGNRAEKNGQLLRYGSCEDAASYPFLSGDAAHSVANGTPTRVSTPAPPDGTYCTKFNKDSAGGGGDADYRFHDHAPTVTTDMAGLIVGKSYTFHLRVRCPAAVAVGNCRVRFSYYDAGAWTDANFNPAAQDTWEDCELTVAIPATATGIRLYATVLSAEAQNDYINFQRAWMQPLGVGNDHTQQFFDSGTGTMSANNSWDF